MLILIRNRDRIFTLPVLPANPFINPSSLAAVNHPPEAPAHA
jgi:hypothetical protein